LSKISNEYLLAFTIVDLNKNDVKFEWTINMEKIEERPTNPYVDLYELLVYLVFFVSMMYSSNFN
jgi:hypothetical protein